MSYVLVVDDQDVAHRSIIASGSLRPYEISRRVRDSQETPPTVVPSTKEEPPVKRLIVLPLVTLAVAAPAAASGSLEQPVVPGFFQGQSVGYFDYGPIKLNPGNNLAPIWTVTNPAAGQH